MIEIFRHFADRRALRAVMMTIIATCAPLVIVTQTAAPAAAQPADAMQPGPGEKAGVLGKGEPLVAALAREKIEYTSARKAIKSLGQLFDPKHARTGDNYVYQVGAGRKLTLLRYQRAKHVFEVRLTETGEYVSRLMQPGELPASQDMIIHAPQTEGIDEEEDVERRAVMGEEGPVPTSLGEDSLQGTNERRPPALDDVRADEDFAPPDAPPQPIDAALAGRQNPDDLPPEPNDLLPREIPSSDEEMPGPAYDDSFDPVADAPSPIEPSSATLEDNMIVPYEAPQIVPIPSRTVVPARADSARSYAPLSLAIACLGLIALIVGILLSVLPAWRARQHIKASGLHIEDEIYISNGQRLALVSDKNHHYLVAVNKTAIQLLTCCDDDDETQRAWSFFKRKTYWHQLGSRPINDRQLKELVEAFNKQDTAADSENEPESSDDEKTKVVETGSTKTGQPLNVTATPTLPGLMINKEPRSHASDDDHETLEVPELTDVWFSK